jgi:hypothetical protein
MIKFMLSLFAFICDLKIVVDEHIVYYNSMFAGRLGKETVYIIRFLHSEEYTQFSKYYL